MNEIFMTKIEEEFDKQVLIIASSEILYPFDLKNPFTDIAKITKQLNLDQDSKL